MAYCLGIDLGTTFTAAAVARQGRAEVVTLGYRATSVPTVAVLTEEGTFVVGDPAERRGATDPVRLTREFKRRVGDPTPVMVGATPVSVDRLLAEMLRFVFRTVTETEGGAPDATVVTHPANWGPYKRQTLDEAIRMADLGPTTMLTEPVAAATWYASAERMEPGATVAVYDLGGGTFDAAVLEMGPDGTFAVRGRPEGIERLGGVDADAAVLTHVLRTVGVEAESLDPEDPAAVLSLARLRRDCVEAKEALSVETVVTIPVSLPDGLGGRDGRDQDGGQDGQGGRGRQDQVLLRRSELEELVAPLFDPSMEALGRAVASAGLAPGDLDAVLLVGGSSRMPFVGREVSVSFGRPIAVDAHPKHPVALGAALVAQHRAAAAATVDAPVPPGAGPGGEVPDGPGGPGGPEPAAASVASPPAPGGPASPGPYGGSGPQGRPGLVQGPIGTSPPRGSFASGLLARRVAVGGGIAAAFVLVVGSTVLWDPLSWDAGTGPTTTTTTGGAAGVTPAGASDEGAAAAGDQGPEVPGDEGTAAGPDAGPGIDGIAGEGGPRAPAGPEVAWEFAVGGEMADAPMTDGQRAYATDRSGHVTAVDVATGAEAWKVPVGSGGISGSATATLAGDVVVASTIEPARVAALDAATGAERWSVPDIVSTETPVVVGDTVVVNDGMSLTALALADGGVRWANDLMDENAFLATTLVGAGDHLVAGSMGGEVIAFDAHDGSVAWREHLDSGEPLPWELSVAGGTVLSYGDDSGVTGMPLASGSPSWNVDLGGPPLDVGAHGGQVAVTTMAGDLVLLDPATGAEQGRVPAGGSTLAELPGEPPLLLVAGATLQALGPDAAVAWESESPFAPVMDFATAPGLIVAADLAGNLAAYRL